MNTLQNNLYFSHSFKIEAKIVIMSSSTILSNTDDNLASSLQKGNLEAFEILYDTYAPALFGILKNITRNENQAEDVLQKSFIQIWNCKNTYDPTKERLFTWVLKIARNITSKSMKENNGVTSNQVGRLYVNDINHDKLKKDKLILELIILGGVSQIDAAEKMGISIIELRQMVRKEINQLRGVAVK